MFDIFETTVNVTLQKENSNIKFFQNALKILNVYFGEDNDTFVEITLISGNNVDFGYSRRL